MHTLDHHVERSSPGGSEPTNSESHCPGGRGQGHSTRTGGTHTGHSAVLAALHTGAAAVTPVVTR